MTVAWNKTLLLWDPEDTNLFGLSPSDFRKLGADTLEVAYARIGKDSGVLREIGSTNAEALIFTRNEDMVGGPPIAWLLCKLRKGYNHHIGH